MAKAVNNFRQTLGALSEDVMIVASESHEDGGGSDEPQDKMWMKRFTRHEAKGLEHEEYVISAKKFEKV